MPTVQAPSIVRPLRLWKAKLADITPGWGLTYECYFLSARKPRRADVLERVEWQEVLAVHPGNLDVQAYEDSKITVEVDPATPEQAGEMLALGTQIRILGQPSSQKEAA